ncbi:MAG TPA: hypothetical protein VLK24_12095, partial [Gaiellaceae bacterium]|nr:hypothetical protein [Gaiellaceae bacterium]
MAKKIDPKAKAKRQKIYAGVGGVILLAVLAFQVPRTLKMMHPADQSSSTPPPATTTPGSTPAPISAPSLSGGNAAPAAAAPGGDGITDPEGVPAPQSGQLLAFGLFRSKDPFIQQINLKGTTGSSGALPSSGSAGATGPTGVVVGGSGGSGGSAQPSPPAAAPAAPTPKTPLTTAVISVNGSPESVQTGGTFPASNPYFKLVSLTKKGAKISIAGGSLENGAPTVTLTKNKAVTLMNTADGT